MDSFYNLKLCRYHDERVSVYVDATLAGGCLTFSCEDMGSFVEDFWGDDDYEYWYRFDEENTTKLLSAINGLEAPAEALLREFSGERGTSKLRDFCDNNGIEYQFSSYV